MPVIDLHCDTIDRMFAEQSNLLENNYHIDLNKLKASDYAAQWFAIFIDVRATDKPLMETVVAMHDYFMQQINLNHRFIEFASCFDDYKRIRSKNKIAAFLSVEEGQVIEGNLDNLKKLCDLGVRMMTFTWNYENDLGFPHSYDKGLTMLGKQAAQYLNSIPVLADISHLSEASVKDLAEVYKKPIIASHCNARSIWNHTRNLSDEVIKKVAQSGGVIGINLYSLFLDGSEKSTLEAISRHIDHIYRVGGEDVMALGTDFDGITCDLEVCSAAEMGKLMAVLNKNYTQQFVDKLMYKNAERIIKENLYE